MIGRGGAICCGIVLAIACGQPIQDQESTDGPSIAHWTLHVTDSNILGTVLGASDPRPEGCYEEAISLHTSAGDSLSARQKVCVDEGKVQEIFLYIKNRDTTSDLNIYEDLFTRLDSIYHPAMPTKGYASWKTASPEGALIEVDITDGRLLFGTPEVIAHWTLYQDRLYED